MRDANYPWLVLVPAKPDLVEILDLDDSGRRALIDEVALAADALRTAVPCDKLNVAALGNSVAQLHIHVIARRTSDPAWPRPVWGVVAASEYPEGEAESLSAAIAATLGSAAGRSS